MGSCSIDFPNGRMCPMRYRPLVQVFGASCFWNSQPKARNARWFGDSAGPANDSTLDRCPAKRCERRGYNMRL